MRNFIIKLLGGFTKNQYQDVLRGWRDCQILLQHYEYRVNELISEANQKEEF